MKGYYQYYCRRAKCFLLCRRLKLRTRDLQALSMQRAFDMQQEKLLLEEIHKIQEALGEFLPLNLNRNVLGTTDDRR